ncbi:MAG: DUF4194 domain-containing protein [Ignavibacteria bacterium]
MNMSTISAPYAPALIKLLQGIIYSDETELWHLLITHSHRVKEYFSVIGLDVMIFESEGFAFLKERDTKDDETPLPSLIIKRHLSYPVTLMCILLLEKLNEFDFSGGQADRLIMSKSEIADMLRVFLPDKSNETRLLDSIEANINKLLDYGFLKKVNEPDKFEVKRILKAKISASTLIELKRTLEEYARAI